jgi:ATP-dependent RNA helicase DHX37/DHR1
MRLFTEISIIVCYPDLETLAYEKVCKIHRNLPDGGILVFLTGRQEIVRMVKRLRKRFGTSLSYKDIVKKGSSIEPELIDMKSCTAEFREMDDEEIDGDLFQRDDDVNSNCEDNSSCDDETEMSGSQSDKPVHILPLYSMLSTEDQTNVFAPVPEGHRLIVVATNIAETSVT